MGMYAQGMKPSHIVSALSVLATMTCALPALAQQAGGFGSKGGFVIGAERLTGVFITSGSSELDGTIGAPLMAPFTFDSDDSSTTFALLGNGLEAEPAAIPRLGFDYFIIDALSVGGAITYASKSENSERQTATGMFANTEDVETKNTMLTLSPRAGYALMFSKLFGFWGRGGISYTSATGDTEVTTENGREDTEFSASLLTLAADAQLIITPIDHVAIGVGAQLDIPLTGSLEVTDPEPALTQMDGDLSILTFGISAGMMMYF